jgi:glycine/D-amino acid oxidase-like deaminating enzyme
LTTLAIIGGGLVGRSLIYTLAKEEKNFEKVTLFSSDKITSPCSLNSTAIAALRGITKGHSPLGDQLVDGFDFFSRHIEEARPLGVEKIIQYNGATEKLDQFKLRYPSGEFSNRFLKEALFLATENAFMIDPKTYLTWLLDRTKSFKTFPIHEVDDLVIEVVEGERIQLKTLHGKSFLFDKVIFTAGSYNRFWKELHPDSKLKSSKPSQGSYLEFQNLSWEMDSFSLTIDGDNVIWNKPFQRLYVGSTTSESLHELPPLKELEAIYHKLHSRLSFELPKFQEGLLKVGLREKAQKREPYLLKKENLIFFGGLYKNAFTLSMKMARDLSHQYL